MSTRLLAFLLCFSAVAAQQKQGKTCRCCLTGSAAWSAAWDWEPRPMTPRPRRTIPITTDSPESQLWFDQGLFHLHAFEELEALHCFRQALKYDPDCGMAHWGVILSLPGTRFNAAEKRLEALKAAQDQSLRLSPTEQIYIKSIGHLVGGQVKEGINDLRALFSETTNHPDAAAFAAYWMRDGYSPTGRPNAGTIEALEILERYLAAHPDHIGLNHYYVHVLEAGPDFEKAMPAAERLTRLAPQTSHLQHMPGHLHFRAGCYDEANAAFAKTHALEKAYLASGRLAPIDHSNYVHNLFFQALSYSRSGEFEKSDAAIDELLAIERPEVATLSHEAALLSQIAPVTRSLLLYQRGDLEGAIAALPDPVVDIRANGLTAAVGEFLRTQLALTQGELETAKQAFTLLSRIQRDAKKMAPSSAYTALAWQRSQQMINLLHLQARAAVKGVEKAGSAKTWQDLALTAEAKLGFYEPPLLPWTLAEAFAADEE